MIGLILVTHGKLAEEFVSAMTHVVGTQDAAVADHIRQDPTWFEAFARIRDLVLLLLPRYRAQGKAYVNIAFGCTGGRHRSVFAAEQLAAALTAAGYTPSVLHRNLSARAADLVEGKPDAVVGRT